MTWAEQAEEYATAITAGGVVKAFHDPQKALNNRPCILVGLPTVDWTEGTLDGAPRETWRLVALASRDTAALGSLLELQKLVEAAADVLPIETATPTTYPLGSSRVPAYVLTLTSP
jgi:hypothetical protein